jgi:hypothetical protein
MSAENTLEGWLAIATRGLSAESTRRVEQEIGAHHREALDAGLSPERALADLGDPAAARRAFRRAYLTSFQESLVKDYRGKPKPWRVAVYSALLVLGTGVAVAGPKSDLQRWVGWIVVAVMAVALANLLYWAPRLYRRGRERAAILIGAFSDFFVYVGLLAGGSFVLGDLSTFKKVFWSSIFCVLLALYLPLLHKLRKDPPELPRV